MVRRVSIDRHLPIDADILWDLISKPEEFIPLWPYLVEYEPGDERSHRVILQLKRFGFSVKARYDIDPSIDADRRKAVYRCTAEDKEFIVSVSVRRKEEGSLVTIEASYSGAYESLSRPLLENFVRRLLDNILGKFKPAKEESPPIPKAQAPTHNLRDENFVARAIITGHPVESGRLKVGSPNDIRVLVNKVLGISEGRVLLIRIRSLDGRILLRVLVSESGVSDAYLESEGASDYGVEVLDRAAELLTGSEVEYLVLEVPS